MKSQSQVGYGDDQKIRNDLNKALGDNDYLVKILAELNSALEKRGIELEDLLPENSGMITASTVLSSSTTKVTTPKPYRG